MRNRNKIAAALSATAVVASGLAAMTTAASAASYTAVLGECLPFGSPAAWTSNFDINFSPANPVVGDTVTVTVAYGNGPSNGPIVLNPGDVTVAGTVTLGGAASGTVAMTGPANTASVGAWAAMPGNTLTGTFTAVAGSNTATFSALTFTGGGVAIPCTPGSGVTESKYVSNAAATITAISSQASTNTTRARFGDVISYDVAGFASAGAATVEICNSAETTCTAAGSITIAANGTGSGTVTVPGSLFAPQAGAKVIRVTKDSDAARAPYTAMAAPAVQANITTGGAGDVITVTGTNWDPSRPVRIQGYDGATQTSLPIGAAVDFNANADGTFSRSYTVPSTQIAAINVTHPYRVPPGNTGSFVVPGSIAFSYSLDSCTAKEGLATTGACELLETVSLTVGAGDLKMSKVPGSVVLSAVELNGQAQTSTGSLQDVTVKDYRGGTLGWSLVGTFNGLAGPVAIPASALTWTPACTTLSGDDTVTVGQGATFGSGAVALCSVATSGFGTDAVSGGDVLADAALDLAVPANQAAGTYAGTLTLTLS